MKCGIEIICNLPQQYLELESFVEYSTMHLLLKPSPYFDVMIVFGELKAVGLWLSQSEHLN